MRDFLAPVIEGFDLSGFVNALSFQCDQLFTSGDNGGTFLDGSTVSDALSVKVRLSWLMNSLSSAQYAALSAALRSGETPDTVRAFFFDPSCNAVRYAKCNVAPPAFDFAFNVGQPMSNPGAEIALTETEPIYRFAVFPPTKTAYQRGEPLALSGLSVTLYDRDDTPADITDQCAAVPAGGEILMNPGPVTLSVRYGPAEIARFPLAVANANAIASGDYWTFYDSGLLYVYCVGDMPYDGVSVPWENYRAQIKSVALRHGVTNVGTIAFSRCANLTSVLIPDGVTAIETWGFAYTSALTRVTLPNSLTSIGDLAFTESGLTSVVIPDRVTNIGQSAFRLCRNLSSAMIPQSVTNIGQLAFADTALTSVTISRNAVTGDNAFPPDCVISYYD